MMTHIKPPYTEEPIDEDSEEDVIEDVYDVTTREDIAIESPASKICGKILEWYNLLSFWY